ncbi:NAD(P)-binding protein [Viridothelium virens]|uniref:NAD(P)-binding protein n=1 Tax=Viridothelium virens TaxID=1048519 RepID=A0A6A6HC05_VIRVR|nr:NAD(P)-binding protein [Viridothelium virens]
MGNILSQFFFIPQPSITEKNCPDQTGRVFFVTGGYAGVGIELCTILYSHNATVYIAGRSEPKAQKAILNIKKLYPRSAGHLEFIDLDLADLSSIKPAIEAFTTIQQRLDVLVNNAGVMFPPEGSTSAQGHELQVATNCLGPYLLYQLLLPILTTTAASSPTGSVRVAWAGSIAVHVASPGPHGIQLDSSGCPSDKGVMPNYGQTKVANAIMAREFAKTTPQTGIVHAAFNPGNLRSELQRHWQGLGRSFTVSGYIDVNFLCYPPINGAYTELWSALAPELTPDKSGAYVFPWGRFGSLPAGVEESLRGKAEGGSGIAETFLAWCRQQTEAFF